MKRLAAALCVLGAAPVSAQELVFSPTATEQCLASVPAGGNTDHCIGESANLCMAQTEGGWSTVGMSGCFDREWQYWDTRLNAAYKNVRAIRRATDAEMKDLGSAAPSQAEALKLMQRGWISYRDATCDYERSLWGGGTGGGPATVSCHMFLTARQALYLEIDAMTQ
ncbi:lysozyme inhibitor LprI family protein [Shimia sp.]|uniref:lysozyme inhibitor LprI family protein n=1 Tax=Shimia sp. TaxID=1954381 RepID=UPI0032987B48